MLAFSRFLIRWGAALGLLLSGLPLRRAAAQLANPLPRLLRADTVRFGRVLRDPARYRLQILYTQINRDAHNRPHFRTFRYRVRPGQYFYPASTVKLPAAVLALQKLRFLRQHPHLGRLGPDSPLRIDSAFAGQTRVARDTSSASGRASIGHYIRKVLLVSDNDAFNRLYEFVGQYALNAELRQRGLRRTRLLHRLSVGDQEPNSRHTSPLVFYADTALQTVVYRQPAAFNARPLPELGLQNERIGQAYWQGNSLVSRPLDFSTKSYFALPDQQRLLRAVLFPAATPPKRRFALDEDDYQLLYRYLSMFPRESPAPRYDAAHYPDTYAKFLLGGGGLAPLPPGVRVFNKIGQAYGFLTDNAYVADFDHGVEFLLSAVLYVNADEVLNDDKYEYDAIGLPFLRDLGRAVYDYERQRPRRYQPDLSRFKQ
ncbi:serine hydrolase [Hymenobacter algoricola]|uniref:Beta-lactamase class A catalytic domain-containing protein n=1 Tax=Hymenobacter algoricola TaxID=486267 RepID=A0ABP7M8K3_9BACT